MNNTTTENEIKTHRHYEKAYQAHANISHYPERGARILCQDLDSRLAEFEKLGASDKAKEKLESLFLDWVNAKSSCMSSFITGGSNFPVRRAEKANDREANRYNDYSNYYKTVTNAINKENYYKKHPEKRPISSDDSDAIERLKEKLVKLNELQKKMKQANKLIRKDDKAGLVELMGEKIANELLKEDRFGGKGFATFQLSNNNANIKRIEGRIRQLESAKQLDKKVIDLGNNISVTQDPDSMRIYFEFDGKPEDKVRTLLKSNGFKWTPSQGHWGRKMTGNAVSSAQMVMKELKEVV